MNHSIRYPRRIISPILQHWVRRDFVVDLKVRDSRRFSESPGRRDDRSPGTRGVLSDGNDGSCFGGSCLGLVVDQFAQERNQHEYRPRGCRRQAPRTASRNQRWWRPPLCRSARGSFPKSRLQTTTRGGIFTRFVALGDRGLTTPALLSKFSDQISSIISRL
jgi:hypothetical protein